MGTDNTNTLKLETDNGLLLDTAGAMTMREGDMIRLMYSSYEGKWVELFRSKK